MQILLLISIDITNLGKTFPLALSYYFSKTVELYNFFFWYLCKEVWVDNTLEPAILMGNQVANLIKVVDILHSVLKSKLQFYN